jgi:Holliday junction resolvase RusA-like endonuclease
MSSATITVIGLPAPQGSKRFVGTSKSGRGILIESSAKVKPWREAVVFAAREQAVRLTGAVSLSVYFTLPKPKSAPKTRRTWADKKPDLSKLVRSTEDALVDAGVIEDDARIVETHSAKVFPGEHEKALDVPGAVIYLRSVTA